MQNPLWLFLSVAVVGYLLGSVNFAVMISRLKGIHILKEGSGNPGATNVKRVLGSRWGNLVFTLDFIKGLAGAILPLLCVEWFWGVPSGDQRDWLKITGMLATVIGHCFSVFLAFRGGKGVASSIGGLMGLIPLVVLLSLPVWLAIFYWKRTVALASIAFVIILPLIAWGTGASVPYLILTVVILVLVVVRHKSNIQRMLKGEENRFDKS